MTDVKRNIKHGEFGTEILIDSTASTEDILKNFAKRGSNNKAYKYYCQLLVPRRNHDTEHLHYNVPGHPLKVFIDGWDGDVSPNYFEPFHFRSTMPKVISEMCNIEKSDPVVQCLKTKSDWKNNLRKSKMSCVLLGVPNKIEYLNDDVLHCPKNIIDLAADLENDPVPNFDSTYNWYYAGNGNMQLICINWIDYLLHSEFNTVYLTQIFKDNNITLKYGIASFRCDDDNNILETVCSSQNVVALRTLHKIVILRVVAEEKPYFEKLKQFESDLQFTGISFDRHHTNILYVTTLNSKLSIVNIDRMTARSVKLNNSSDSLLNNWNVVAGSQRSSYVHVERSAVTMYDKRTHSKACTWSGINNLVDEWSCNDISAAELCPDSPGMYISTSHHVFLMDIRYSKHSKLRPVQRWTHGLKCAPTYMTLGKAGHNKEILWTSSQWCEDACVISNYEDSVSKLCEIPGVSMPYHPPNIMTVLREARNKMLCLDVYNPIDSRLVTSTSGQVIFEQNENLIMLTQNSLGDIFCRTLYPQYMESFLEGDSAQRLHDWAQSYKPDRKPFEVSSVNNIAHVWQKLIKVPDSYNFGPTDQEFDESNVFKLFEDEKLSPEFLDAWNETRDDEGSKEQSSLALNLHYELSDSE